MQMLPRMTEAMFKAMAVRDASSARAISPCSFAAFTFKVFNNQSSVSFYMQLKMWEEECMKIISEMFAISNSSFSISLVGHD